MRVVLAGGFKEVVEAAGLFEVGADDRSHSGLPCPPFPLVSACQKRARPAKRALDAGVAARDEAAKDTHLGRATRRVLAGALPRARPPHLPLPQALTALSAILRVTPTLPTSTGG